MFIQAQPNKQKEGLIKLKKKRFCVGVGIIVMFALWTLLVRTVDVKPIGPQGSKVGFSTLNSLFHNLTGVKMYLYNITDWLGLVPIVFAFGFAVLGTVQWIKRKSIMKVDKSILMLGGVYIITLCAYVLLEMFVVNYRPVLINGFLEASYPSSTTLLVLCVMPTSIMQFNERIKDVRLRNCARLMIVAFIIFMLFGRLMSGVHWITDIVGGILLSTGIVIIYYSKVNG